MVLNVRNDVLPFTTGIETTHIYNSSRLLSTIIGFPIARNKAIVGENAFSHEAGIHQDGVLKYRQTYEIMTPETVGRDDHLQGPGDRRHEAARDRPPRPWSCA